MQWHLIIVSVVFICYLSIFIKVRHLEWSARKLVGSGTKYPGQWHDKYWRMFREGSHAPLHMNKTDSANTSGLLTNSKTYKDGPNASKCQDLTAQFTKLMWRFKTSSIPIRKFLSLGFTTGLLTCFWGTKMDVWGLQCWLSDRWCRSSFLSMISGTLVLPNARFWCAALGECLWPRMWWSTGDDLPWWPKISLPMEGWVLWLSLTQSTWFPQGHIDSRCPNFQNHWIYVQIWNEMW